MRPIVYVQTSGGVAFICSSGDVEVVHLDWDDLEADLPSVWRNQINEALEVIRPYATEGDNQETFSRHVENLEEMRGK